MKEMEGVSVHPREMLPPSYSPVGWLSPLNSINFHFPNLISWIFSISLSPPALRIKCCKIIFSNLGSQPIGEIITNSFSEAIPDSSALRIRSMVGNQKKVSTPRTLSG